MIASQAMIHANRKTMKMASVCAEEFPMSVQLAGCEPAMMAEAARLNADRGAAPTATLLDPKGELGKLYGAQTTPHMYVIKGDGTLALAESVATRPIETVRPDTDETLQTGEPIVAHIVKTEPGKVFA